MQYKPVLLALSGVAAACLAYTLMGPGDTVTVEKKTFTKGHSDVLATDAERLHVEDHRPKFKNAALEDTGGRPMKGHKAGPGRPGAMGPGGGPGGPGANMVMVGRDGGIAQQRQAAMTPEQAEQQHQQAWRGMQQGINRIATKHNLSADVTTELSTALESYMNSQKSLWDSVAAGDISQEEAMAQSEQNRTDVQGQISGAAGPDVADEMGGMLGGGAPGDAQGGTGQPPPGQGGQQPPPPGGGGQTPPPGGGGMTPPPGGGGMGPPPSGGMGGPPPGGP
jgi:hypothetical protein